MDANVVMFLVKLAADEAPEIIKAIQHKGGTVQDVGPILEQDAATIDADLARLKGELDPPTP